MLFVYVETLIVGMLGVMALADGWLGIEKLLVT